MKKKKTKRSEAEDYYADGAGCDIGEFSLCLTLILLTWTIWRAPTNASKWRMGFNSAFKGLTLILLTRTIWRAPTNASKWRMGFNSEFKGLTLILLTWTIWRAPTNAIKWRMGFNSAFKGLIVQLYRALTLVYDLMIQTFFWTLHSDRE